MLVTNACWLRNLENEWHAMPSECDDNHWISEHREFSFLRADSLVCGRQRAEVGLGVWRNSIQNRPTLSSFQAFNKVGRKIIWLAVQSCSISALLGRRMLRDFFSSRSTYGNGKVGVWWCDRESHTGEMVCFEIRSLRKKNIYIYIQKSQSLNEAINLGTFHSLTYWVLFLT